MSHHYYSLPLGFEGMPAIYHRSFLDAREPGNIQVTPIPIEVPIHSRPILHSSHANATFSFSAVKHPASDQFHWGLLILMIFMLVSFAVMMSKWGWNKITGQIWKLSSGWPGSVEDEEELLASQNEVTTLEMQEIEPEKSSQNAGDIMRQGELESSRNSNEDIYE